VRACGFPSARACACAYVHIALLIQHATRMRRVTSFVAPRCPLYFSTLSHKWCDFRKTVTEHKMCVLIFCTTFVWNVSHSKKNLARYGQKYRNVFVYSTRYFCRTLIKVELLRHIFEKVSNIKFHQNPWTGSRVVPCGRTDGHDEAWNWAAANNRFSKFCERA
jgi:hypothetical protein